MDYDSEKPSFAAGGFLPLWSGRGKQPEQKTESPLRRTKWSAYHTHSLVCVGLHVFLILMHLVLLGVCLGHREQSVIFALTPFSLEWYPLIATAAMQILGTIYLAVLVAVTQSLAFRRDLYIRQTLTALHDKGNAWLGIGSAVIALCEQVKLRAAAVGVLAITIYLLGVWVLHISIPIALDVVPFNSTLTTVNRTILANLTSPYANYASAYDILSLYGQVPMLGLQDNMVYDVIPQVANANGTATVNASVYTVDCAAIPPVDSQISAVVTNGWGGSNATYLYFHVDPKPDDGLSTAYTASLPYEAPGVYTGQIADMEHACTRITNSYNPGTCWMPIVVLSTVDVLDSSGNEAPVSGGPWRAIEAPVVVPVPNAGPPVMITAVQLLGCNVGITNVHIDVSVDTRMPVAPSQGSQSDATWKTWSWPENLTLTDQLRIAQSAPYFSPPSAHSSFLNVAAGSANFTSASPPAILSGYDIERFRFDPPESNIIPNEILYSSSMISVVPTAFDVFLSEDLRLQADNRTSVGLAEINHSLAKALAATFWYGNNVNYSGAHAISRLIQPQNSYSLASTAQLNLTSNGTNAETTYGEAKIVVVIQQLRLNLSFIPIVVGLATSVMLLVLCICVTRVPAAARANFDPNFVVDSGGLLQYTWLLGTEPGLAQVESPESHNLRAAGMFNVDVSDRMRRRQLSRMSTFVKEDLESSAQETRFTPF